MELLKEEKMKNLFAIILLLETAYASSARAEVPVEKLKAVRQAVPELKEKVLLYFWASWCPDCREKLGGPLPELAREFPKASVLTVNADRDVEKGLAYAEEKKLALPVYRDEDKALTKQLKLFGVPAWAVVERKKDGSFALLKAATGSDLAQIRALLGGK